MSQTPQFLFDVGSPNAFLSHEAIPAIERRIGVRFDYVPVLLGGIFKATNNRSPAESLAGIKNKPEFHAVETARFLKRYNVQPYVWNPFFPVNTLNLMRAAVAAQVEGVFEAYVEAAFHHMWREPKKMDDPEVALAAFTTHGVTHLASSAGLRSYTPGVVTVPLVIAPYSLWAWRTLRASGLRPDPRELAGTVAAGTAVTFPLVVGAQLLARALSRGR